MIDERPTTLDRGQRSTILELIEERCRTAPDHETLLAPDRTPLTALGLSDLSHSIADQLTGRGIRRSDRVALVVSNGPEAASAFLSIASTAACAPLNPTYQADELEYFLTDLRARAIIVESGLATPARDVAAALGIDVLELIPQPDAPAGSFLLFDPGVASGARDKGRLTRDGPSDLDGGPSRPAVDDIALVLHTSGTTARPKMVPLRHGQLTASAANIAASLGLSPADRCLNVMPLFHIHGLVAALLATLQSGGGLVSAPGFLAPRFFDWIDAFGPTWYTAVPTIHRSILGRADRHRDVIARHPLRFVRSSSAPLPSATAEALEAALCAPVIEAYGMTEAAHQMASNPLPPGLRKLGSVGPAVGPSIAILDLVGQPIARGEIGEVAVRGATIFAGYDGDPAVNESAFVDGWFRTGDQGLIDDDGYLFLRGRLKEIINRGGEKVSPLEVDEVLAAHPAVVHAVTFAIPDARLGEDVAAVIVLRDGAAETEESIQAFTAERLAPFKVPRRVVFVESIPTGPTGKVQRIGLAERLGLLGIQQATPSAQSPMAPRTELERRLVEIWRDVLDAEPVGITDDFFDLGGDSLLGARMLLQVHESVGGPDLPLVTLLWAPTIERLAVGIETGDWGATRSWLVPIQPAGSRPPFFFVHLSDDIIGAATLRRSLDPQQPFYGLRAFGEGAPSIPPSVPELADAFEAEIRAVQPDGPYFLGGYCSGGRVAVEIAERIASHGAAVGLLLLVDPRIDVRKGPLHYLRRVPHHLRQGSLGRATIATIRNPVRRFREPDPERPMSLDGYLDALAQARKADARHRYAGSVTIFSSRDYHVPRATWEDLADHVDWHDLPVPHETAFQGDNATVFGAEVQTVVQRAQAAYVGLGEP